MTAFEMLTSYKKLYFNILNIENEIEELRQLATSVSKPIDSEPVQQSSEDKTGKLVAQIVDLQNDRKDKLQKMLVEKTKIIRLIERVSNPTYYRILYARYIEFKTLVDIAAELHYSYPHICALHKEAIAAVTELM